MAERKEELPDAEMKEKSLAKLLSADIVPEKDLADGKRVFVEALGEKCLEFYENSQKMIQAIDALWEEKEMSIDIKLTERLYNDAETIMFTYYKNIQQLLSCVYHQYNFEDGIQTRTPDMKEVKPNFELVKNAKTIRNNYSQLLEKFLQWNNRTIMPSLRDGRHQKNAFGCLVKIMKGVKRDVGGIAAESLKMNFASGRAVEKAHFLIEDEQKRLLKFIDHLKAKYREVLITAPINFRFGAEVIENHKPKELEVFDVLPGKRKRKEEDAKSSGSEKRAK